MDLRSLIKKPYAHSPAARLRPDEPGSRQSPEKFSQLIQMLRPRGGALELRHLCIWLRP